MKLEIVITMQTHQLIFNAWAQRTSRQQRTGMGGEKGDNLASVLVCFGELAACSEIKRGAVLCTLHLSNKKKGET